jgi:hypothetical protein
MGFIERAALETNAGAELEKTLDRIKQGTDYGTDAVRPFDPKQAKEWQEELAEGKSAEIYRQCLESHGFVWWPLSRLQAQALPGVMLLTEGQWRNLRLKPALAFTPKDLTSGFPTGPESLDRFIREHKLAAQIKKGRAPKEALTRARQRR